MTRLWPCNQPIQMEESQNGEPVRFAWQDRQHKVSAIAQRWDADTDWWSEEGRVCRSYFAVLTTGGLFCVLYYDRLEQTWRLEKVYD